MPSIDAHQSKFPDRRLMLAHSAKRIAWFLALRQIFQFPAYPMAPLPGRHHARRVAAFESGRAVDGPDLIPGSYPNSLPFRQGHPIAALTNARDRNSAPNEVADVLTR